MHTQIGWCFPCIKLQDRPKYFVLSHCYWEHCMTRSQCISPPPCSALCCMCISTPPPNHPPTQQFQGSLADQLPQFNARSSWTYPSSAFYSEDAADGGGDQVPAISGTTSQFCPPCPHTPSIAFRHLPPNSARFSYATDLVISTQLSTDAVSALRKGLGTDKTVEAAYRPSMHINMRCIHPR